MSADHPREGDDLKTAAIEAAIQWHLQMFSGNPNDFDRHAFEAWLGASPMNDQAWRHLESALSNVLHRIEPKLLAGKGALRRSLVRPQDAQRRRLGRLLLIGGVFFGGTALIDRRLPLRQLGSEFVTGTGERRRVSLPDGSTMELDARSAADIDFSDNKRVVRLRTGAAIFEVASQRELLGSSPAAVRQPLRILTDPGEVHVDAGRLLMRCEASRSLCVALEGESEIVTFTGTRGKLAQGEGAWFDKDSISAARRDLASNAAWHAGQLEVHNESLHEIVAALGRYRPGLIRVSPAAGNLRVSGLFPLDDTERALDALRHTLPITVRRFGSIYVMIDLQATRG